MLKLYDCYFSSIPQMPHIRVLIYMWIYDTYNLVSAPQQHVGVY